MRCWPGRTSGPEPDASPSVTGDLVLMRGGPWREQTGADDVSALGSLHPGLFLASCRGRAYRIAAATRVPLNGPAARARSSSFTSLRRRSDTLVHPPARLAADPKCQRWGEPIRRSAQRGKGGGSGLQGPIRRTLAAQGAVSARPGTGRYLRGGWIALSETGRNPSCSPASRSSTATRPALRTHHGKATRCSARSISSSACGCGASRLCNAGSR